MTWCTLTQELDAWSADGKEATFWWRDDDAATLTPNLELLLTVAERYQVPVALASIPSTATQALASAVADSAMATVLQHGYSHHNHRRPNGASEFPQHRDGRLAREEIKAGWQRLSAIMGGRLEPIFVPPWGHIAETFLPELAQLGFRGISRFDPRPTRHTFGLTQLNAHTDIVKWRPAAHFRGESKCLGQLVAHLQARRSGLSDPEEPTGLLSHHLDHDDACFAFLERFLEVSSAHPAVRWQSAHEALDEAHS